MAIKEEIKEQINIRVKMPRQYQVLIYNDDFTPMDFVVEVLMQESILEILPRLRLQKQSNGLGQKDIL